MAARRDIVAQPARLLDGVREYPRQAAESGTGHALAEDLAIQRVVEAGDKRVLLTADRDKAMTLCKLHCLCSTDRHEEPEIEGLSHGQELDDLNRLRRQLGEPRCHQIEQPFWYRHREAKHVDATAQRDRARLGRRAQQLAEMEWIAGRLLKQPLQARSGDRPTQHRGDNRLGRGQVERSEIDPLGQVVLPQCGDRVRGAHPGPDGKQDPAGPHLHQVVDQRRRAVVEEVRVVEQEEPGRPDSLSREDRRRVAEQSEAVTGRYIDPGEEGREGAERYRCGGRGGDDPRHGHPVRRQDPRGLAG